jgi:predicted RNase H-like HicB family nuclease
MSTWILLFRACRTEPDGDTRSDSTSPQAPAPHAERRDHRENVARPSHPGGSAAKPALTHPPCVCNHTHDEQQGHHPPLAAGRLGSASNQGKPSPVQTSGQTRSPHRAASEERSADWNGPRHIEVGRNSAKMNYPIAIESERGKAYGVEVPDLPGCFSAGETLDEAVANARAAVEFHLESLLDAGAAIPAPRPLEAWVGKRPYSGRTWAVVQVDLGALSGKTRRLNISLPERVVRRIDAAAARSGESRSGFLARIALQS